MGQLQTQISYFRLIFRLLKNSREHLPSTMPRTLKLTQSLLAMLGSKMNEVRQLKYLPASSEEREEFRSSKAYRSLQKVLEEYEGRYRRDLGDAWQKESEGVERGFISSLSHTLNMLYSQLDKMKLDELPKHGEELQLLEDLITFSRLYMMDGEHDWASFHQKSNVAEVMSSNRKEVSGEWWAEAKESFRQLIKQ